MNEVCPICRKNLGLPLGDADMLGDIVSMLKKWETVGWMLEDGTVILYHKYCLEEKKK